MIVEPVLNALSFMLVFGGSLVLAFSDDTRMLRIAAGVYRASPVSSAVSPSFLRCTRLGHDLETMTTAVSRYRDADKSVGADAPTSSTRCLPRRCGDGPWSAEAAATIPATGPKPAISASIQPPANRAFTINITFKYSTTLWPEQNGTVTVNMAAGAVTDDMDNPNFAAPEFSIEALLTPVPAVPTTGLLLLGAALAAATWRRRERATRP